jgi:hypothetical protein
MKKEDLGYGSEGSDAGSDTTITLPGVRTMFLPFSVYGWTCDIFNKPDRHFTESIAADFLWDSFQLLSIMNPMKIV